MSHIPVVVLLGLLLFNPSPVSSQPPPMPDDQLDEVSAGVQPPDSPQVLSPSPSQDSYEGPLDTSTLIQLLHQGPQAQQSLAPPTTPQPSSAASPQATAPPQPSQRQPAATITPLPSLNPGRQFTGSAENSFRGVPFQRP